MSSNAKQRCPAVGPPLPGAPVAQRTKPMPSTPHFPVRLPLGKACTMLADADGEAAPPAGDRCFRRSANAARPALVCRGAPSRTSDTPPPRPRPLPNAEGASGRRSPSSAAPVLVRPAPSFSCAASSAARSAASAADAACASPSERSRFAREAAEMSSSTAAAASPAASLPPPPPALPESAACCAAHAAEQLRGGGHTASTRGIARGGRAGERAGAGSREERQLQPLDGRVFAKLRRTHGEKRRGKEAGKMAASSAVVVAAMEKR